jgi:hypothetical protein
MYIYIVVIVTRGSWGSWPKHIFPNFHQKKRIFKKKKYCSWIDVQMTHPTARVRQKQYIFSPTFLGFFKKIPNFDPFWR